MPASLAGRLRFEVEQTLKGLYADESLVNHLDDLYLPFASWVNQKVRPHHDPLIIGLGGAQGCGKTTFGTIISRILCKGFDLKCAVLSLDDLYSTRLDRLHYAEKVNPLFSVRGVPGTHDIPMALMLFDRLKNLKEGEVMRLPAFDKSLDDRKPVHLWAEIEGPIDVIIFEGWCVGAPPMPETELAPINRLEEEKDKDGAWRHAINEKLKTDYQRLFSNIDIMMWMQAPDYDVVYTWRNKQERLLEAHLYDIHGGVLDTLDLKIMSPEALKGFMQYYERVTRYLLKVMPERSDILFRLNYQQEVTEVRFPIEH